MLVQNYPSRKSAATHVKFHLKEFAKMQSYKDLKEIMWNISEFWILLRVEINPDENTYFKT